MKNRKIGLIACSCLIAMLVFFIIPTFNRSTKLVAKESSSIDDTPRISINSSNAFVVNEKSEFRYSQPSNFKERVSIQFPKEMAYNGFDKKNAKGFAIEFDKETSILTIQNNNKDILDEEEEFYTHNLLFYVTGLKEGEHQLSVQSDDSNVTLEDLFVSVKLPVSGESLATSGQILSARAATTVSTWQEFVDAMGNSSVSDISLLADITAESRPILGTYSRSIVINGNGKELNMGGQTITLGAAPTQSIFRMTDIRLTGSGTSQRVSASAVNSTNWELQLADVDIATSAGTRTIFELERGKITIDGGVNRFNNTLDTASDTRGMFTSELFTVKNNAQVSSSVNNAFFYSARANTQIIIIENSQLNLHAEVGLIFNIQAQGSFLLDGQQTSLKGSGNRVDTGDDGTLIALVGNGSTITLDNGATLDIKATGTPAMILQSLGGVFTVDHGSTMKLTSSGAANARGATLRFRSQGSQTFNISNNSLIEINKVSGGTSTTAGATTPAIRMYGGNNSIKVASGGKMSVYTEGNGSPQDPGSVNGNQGIVYTNGGNNTFELADKQLGDTQSAVVNVDADNGAAIDMRAENGGNLIAGKKSIFVANGKTASANQGIFNTNQSDIKVDNPLYFDFRNERNGGGMVFDIGAGTTSNPSIFTSTESNLSVWKKGANLDGDPTHNWPLFDYSLSGANFSKIVSYTDNTFPTLYGEGGQGASAYARMSGNNAAPIVDELRQSTNADQSAFGHITVPVGDQETGRDAWTDEAYVKLKITTKTGKVSEVVGTTVGMNNNNPGMSIYGESPRAGLFKVDNVPTSIKAFLAKGDRVEVVKAWRGVLDETSKRNIFSQVEDLKAPPVVTQDVTPPGNLLAVTRLSNATKQIEGTIDLFDQRDQEELSEVKLFVKVNGQFLKSDGGDLISETITANSQPSNSTVKKWIINLPRYVELSDENVEVYAKDTTTLTETAGKTDVINPPRTYTAEPDGVYGNLSENSLVYDSYEGYHDAIKDERFDPSRLFNIQDVVPSQPHVIKTVSSDRESEGQPITQIGSVLSYTVEIQNKDSIDSEKVWYNARLTDVIPTGLDFKLSEANVEMAFNGVAVSLPKVIYHDQTRQLEVELGDLAPQDKATITFKTVVNQEAVDTVIENTAWGIGESPQEFPFVPGPVSTEASHIVIKNSGSVKNPGGIVAGKLVLESVPAMINFGQVSILDFQKKVGADKTNIDTPLVITDNRKTRPNWDVTAKIMQEMTNGTDDYPGALKYVYNNREFTLTDEAKTIYVSDSVRDDGIYNISDSWQKSDKADGIKLEIDSSKAPKTTGTYEGIIKWTLRDTIQ
ncbi:pectate lyase-like adhesive domain-containing protein [uncultured Vagococcus sp.]|uniref:pectate lyase-like adhesive domain-containing protein n=1 Tax=uncultured Vagococcus sp. TaxID=189676 RepID=UPI0028D72172|nr:pectate lyase-like adhesive domain-containing protein [uncultured Vagococcus sp.]